METHSRYGRETTENWYYGRVALITGASSGMGYAIALALGRAGAQVGVNFRKSRAPAEALCKQIADAGGRGIAIQADVSDGVQVHRMFDELGSSFGDRLDMLVNNAGDWMDKCSIVDCPAAQWQRMLDVNLTSVFLCCQHAARRMIRQGSGSIVNMGSVAGHTGGGGGTVPYAAAKGAVHTFTRGLAKELGPHGIRVNAVAPGFVDTPMIAGRVSAEAAKAFCASIPLGRISQPDELVPLVMFLLSPASAYMTGQIIDINGGLLMR